MTKLIEMSQYKTTKICEHFEKGQFTIHPGLASFVGYKTKCKVLTPGTIPTVIFSFKEESRQKNLDVPGHGPTFRTTTAQKKVLCCEKREHELHNLG
jgi:hypothetical protein